MSIGVGMGVSETTAVSGQRRVSMHPLAIASMCDHFTRVQMRGSKQPSSDVLGLLFGVQDGLDVSIFDASEAVYAIDGGKLILNGPSVHKKTELFSAVYPSYELLGWYNVCEVATALHLEIHRQVMQYNESPLFVMMHPNPSPEARSLPVVVHECEVHVVDEFPTMLFVPLSFKLETSQAEQISVEQVAKSTPTDSQSSLTSHSMGTRTSLRTLSSKIKILVCYLEDVRAGRIPTDYSLLRRVGNIVSQLGAEGQGTNFDKVFSNDVTDAMMVTYLAAVTKTSQMITELSDKYTLVYGDRVGKRGF